MSEMNKIGNIVDAWIHESELPVRPTLKVIRKYDIYQDMSDTEMEAHKEFIRWFLKSEHQLILSIPSPEPVFFGADINEFGIDESAFNTHDFERLHPFNKYHYRLKKVYERLQDIAITHSCISDPEAKQRRMEQFKNIVRSEFRDKAVEILEHYKKHPLFVDKEKAFDRIRELNAKIRKCKRIWKEYAYWE